MKFLVCYFYTTKEKLNGHGYVIMNVSSCYPKQKMLSESQLKEAIKVITEKNQFTEIAFTNIIKLDD